MKRRTFFNWALGLIVAPKVLEEIKPVNVLNFPWKPASVNVPNSLSGYVLEFSHVDLIDRNFDKDIATEWYRKASFDMVKNKFVFSKHQSTWGRKQTLKSIGMNPNRFPQ